MQLDKKTTIFFVIVFIILVSLLLIPWGCSKPKQVRVEREFIVGDFSYNKPMEKQSQVLDSVIHPKPSAPPRKQQTTYSVIPENPYETNPLPPNLLGNPCNMDPLVSGIPKSDPFASGG